MHVAEAVAIFDTFYNTTIGTSRLNHVRHMPTLKWMGFEDAEVSKLGPKATWQKLDS